MLENYSKANNSFASFYPKLIYVISLSSPHLSIEPVLRTKSSHFVALLFLFLTLMKMRPTFCHNCEVGGRFFGKIRFI